MRYVFLWPLLIFSPLALGQSIDHLACFMNNTITMDGQGRDVDVRTYRKEEDAAPSFFQFFDFSTMTTTFFWRDFSNDQRYKTQEPLTRISDTLYYGKYATAEYSGYTSYLFTADKSQVMLSEMNHTEHFTCEPASVDDIAAEYAIDFSAYQPE